jgi:hypothetical protein
MTLVPRSGLCGGRKATAMRDATDILPRATLPCLAALCIFSHPAIASGQAPTVDQSYAEGGLTGFSIAEPHLLAQTFTVGVTGKLTRIDLGVRHYPLIDPSQILTVVILPTSDLGVPLHNQPLAVVQLTPAEVSPLDGALTRVDLGPQAIAVQQGEVLAVSASSVAGMTRGYVWRAHEDVSPGLPYTRGSAFSRGLSTSPNNFAPREADAHFITYVTVPEPSGLIVMAIGGSLIYARRRR